MSLMVTTSTPATAACPICGSAGTGATLIPHFLGETKGHVWCRSCRGSFDSDAAEIRAVEMDAEKLAGIANREDYRKLFVETWEIADASGDVYPAFQWEDNESVQQGVARHVLEAIARHNRAAEPAILDLGCGNGFTTKILAGKFGAANIIGLDPSPMIRDLERRTGVRGIRGTLDTVKFDDGQFDIVVIVGNLMLHPDMRRTLKEAHRVLKPGGLAIFDFKNIDSSSRRISRWLARSSRRLAANRFVQRNFLNMRYGLARRHVDWLLQDAFDMLEIYDKPPRLLEFSNRSHWQSGLAGAAWRSLNALDRMLGQQAWIQVAARKRAA
jgi:SAM-dependent methyltransferase